MRRVLAMSRYGPRQIDALLLAAARDDGACLRASPRRTSIRRPIRRAGFGCWSVFGASCASVD